MVSLPLDSCNENDKTNCNDGAYHNDAVSTARVIAMKRTIETADMMVVTKRTIAKAAMIIVIKRKIATADMMMVQLT